MLAPYTPVPLSQVFDFWLTLLLIGFYTFCGLLWPLVRDPQPAWVARLLARIVRKLEQ